MKCKVCGGEAREKFSLPRSKVTGKPIPDLPDDCPYYECEDCRFLFSTVIDEAPDAPYDQEYWETLDPEHQWWERSSQTLRLVLLANRLCGAPPWRLRILDFGAGQGAFVHDCRANLDLAAYGYDTIEPRYASEYFVRTPQEGGYDVIVACGVVEHLTDPLGALMAIHGWLVPGGVFAFNVICYEPERHGRDWEFVGPRNGHVSLYSAESLNRLYRSFGGVERLRWNGYDGTQAWRRG